LIYNEAFLIYFFLCKYILKMSVQNISRANDYTIYCKDIELTTINGSPYPPSSGGLTVVAPVAPTDSNGMIISSNTVKLEFADGSRPGILSSGPAVQAIGGVKAFGDGVLLPSSFTANVATLISGACPNALFDLTVVNISDAIMCIHLSCNTVDNLVVNGTDPITLAIQIPPEFRPTRTQTFMYYYNIDVSGPSINTFPKHLGFGTLTQPGIINLFGDACGIPFNNPVTTGGFGTSVGPFNMATTSFIYGIH
jgi:hypothetical protein